MCIIKNLLFFIILCGLFLLIVCKATDALQGHPADSSSISENSLRVFSPNGRIQVILLLKDGVVYYKVSYDGKEVIRRSKLGFVFKDAEPLNQNLAIASSKLSTFDETWIQPWGEVKEIRNHYNELRVKLEETVGTYRRMIVVFRVYDDGLGFRYELPKQKNLSHFRIMNEDTEFVLAGDHQAWWIPAYRSNRYEYLYKKSPISSLDNVRAVHTPLTMETADGLFLSIHEANLTDYASMTLRSSTDNTLLCDLVPWSDGIKVRASTPHQTPWRTIQIAEKAGDLLTSYLILNLNEPNKLGDVSWVKPGKYIGIWWGMHINKYTWGSGERHGATTKNTKRYIDFAARCGFSGVLVEGWNVGWDGDWIKYGNRFSFTNTHNDYDLDKLSAYATDKGTRLIGHHETSAAVSNYEDQLESAFALCRRMGINTVKTGYVGGGRGIKRRNKQGEVVGLEWHHGQYMVRHYRKVVETAAKYRISLDVHEPIKDTGIRRTYPNMMTREGARGQEYNAWDADGGNPPEHTTILPFTRLLGGPFDFTPGIFDLLFEKYKPDNRVNTTLAKQLALYVILYSPLHMAADLPENYEGHPAFQFIVDVPVDWQKTVVVNAAIGDYIAVVRHDRNSRDWYLGSITDENRRTLEVPLDFLEAGKKYVAEIYADAAEADWESNPLPVNVYQVIVDSNTRLKLKLAPGGGQAIRFRPATGDEVKRISAYRL